MRYVIVAADDERILFISNTMGYQDNGNYLINNGTLAIPPSICMMYEVQTIPANVEPEKWCYIDGQFVPNPNRSDSNETDVDEVLDIIEGKAVV